MQRKLPIFYSALLLTGVNLLLRLVSTAFQVYLSGQIGAAGIGLLQLILSVGALSTTFGMAGVRTATMYITAEELGKKRPGNVRWVLAACFLYSILCSGTMVLILQIFAPHLARYWIGNSRAADAIRLYSGFVPVFCLCGVMTGYFTAANRIGTLAIVEILEQLFCMAITLSALMLWAGTDPVKACQCVILGSGAGACLTLCCLVALRLREPKSTVSRIPVGDRLIRAAVPLALGDDLKAGISTAENLMVPKRLALYPGANAPLAAFGTVCGMVFPVLMFPASILFALAELLIPELARCAAAGSKQRIRYLVKRGLKIAMLYGCLFAGLEYLLAETLCIRLYNSVDAGIHLKAYAFLIPMLYCDALTDAMTKGLGQQKACVRYNILTSFLDVAFLYILLPRYGMSGYFVSFTVTHLLNFLLSFNRLRKIVGKVISLQELAIAPAAAGVSLLAAGVAGSPPVACIAFAAIWFCLLILMGVVRREDLGWLSNLIVKKDLHRG